MKMQKIITSALTAILLCPASAYVAAQTPVPFITTIAGLPTGTSNTACTGDIVTAGATFDGDGCLPTQATLSAPSSNAVDIYGNIYISDYTHKQFRVIYQGGPFLGPMLIAASPAIANFTPIPGRIYTLAGGLQGVLATTGTSPNPKALYCNQAGNGTVALGTNGDGCPGTQGYLQPRGIAVDAYGNIYVSSVGGGEGMRVIFGGGTVATNPAYNLVATLNAITTPLAGYIYSIVGNNTAGYAGDNGGTNGTTNGRSAKFENVRDVVVDSFGNLFISDGNSKGAITNNDIRVIYNGGTAVANLITASYPGATPTVGYIYTVVGSKATVASACPTTPTFSGDGGPAPAAQINAPYVMFLDPNNNLYFTDSCNGRLRVVYTAGTIPNVTNPVAGDIYTVAGGGTLTGGASGVAATQLNIALMQSGGIDQAGNIYIVDNTSKFVWKMDPNTGIATLLAGIGTATASGAGAFCNGVNGPKSVDSVGDGCPALQTAVGPSLRITGDNFGNLYSIDNGVLRKYSFNNIFPTTNVGSNVSQYVGFTVPAVETDSFTLEGVATSEFSDTGNACAAIAAVPGTSVCAYNVTFTPAQAGARNGAIQLTSVGNVVGAESLTGVGTASQLSVDPGTQSTLGSSIKPQGVAADLSGNLYVADAQGNRVMKINIAANTSSVAVTGLGNPNQVAVDGTGNIYVADTGNNRVVKHPANGGADTAAGTGLSAPQGVAVDSVGNIYIADTGNNRIVLLVGGVQQIYPITGLSQPTRITLDAAGNIYVADTGNSRVVEFVAGQGQTVVNFGTTVKPAGIAVDAAGDLYIADLNSLSLLELIPGATPTVNTLVSTLTAPADVAAGPSANVYVADTSATGILAVNRALGAINFPITNIGDTSSESMLLTNTGNAALSFPGPTLATGPSGSFAVVAAAANSCAMGTPVVPTASCVLNATFTPVTPGSPSQNFVFVTNAANAVSAQLTGTGAHLTGTTTSIATMPASTSTIGFGTSVVVSTTVALTSNVGAPTGTIKITVDGQARTPVSYGTGTVTVTLNPAVGTHVVTAQFSGDLLYASSGSSTSFTVSKASTTTTLSVATSAPAGTPTVTFTANVSSPTASGETGTVTFYSGATQLGQPISLTTGSAVVTYATTSIVFPSSSFTAIYSGDANFIGSTSAVFTPPADFTLATSSPSLAIAQGGVASAIITVTPIFGSTGTVTPTCSNLPQYAVCRFQPTYVTFSGNAAIPISINLFTDVPPTYQSSLQHGGSNGLAFAMLAPWGFGSLAMLAFGYRKRRRLLTMVVLLAGTFFATTTMTGCLTPIIPPTTPAGTQNVTVTFTLTGGSSTQSSHALSFAFTVNTP